MTVAPEGRRLLRVEARNAETPIERKPSWIRTTAKMGPEYAAMNKRVSGQGLHTVCQEAGCPNIFECWEDREATFLIGGDTCTRRCDFCDIATGRPGPLDQEEPRKVAESIRQMNLRYATITGVARDDLPDGAAKLYADTIREVHALNPNTGVEILPPDFGAKPELVGQVFDARPEVFAHNLETVPRIFRKIRPAFTYEKSLKVITMAKEEGLVTKSNLILGMGETEDEIAQAIRDLHDAGCDILTITQYLRPSPLHHPIDRWVKPEEFITWSEYAEETGILGVMAGPLVRSSYRAGRLWAQAMRRAGRPLPEHLAHLEKSADEPARQEASSLLTRHAASSTSR
ncbi:lipoyl synthase [Mobilicoccus pelagius]|uniref:Lipoyl synthase n=1 Tax=Mobilicoccus pelagius NBRC 104925 TaxID=1089455 RepID=H5UQ47_9MICO|nr:lipoyl synthase [Mobilicoccus pelagius]GAB47852.1 lipoyl synthase [Mobilicoccus pelagius NBRC 104925]